MYVKEFLSELGFDEKIQGSVAGVMVGETLGLPYENGELLEKGELPKMSALLNESGLELSALGEGGSASEMSLMTLFSEGNLDALAAWFMQWSAWSHVETDHNTQQVLFDALGFKLEEGVSAASAAQRASEAYAKAYPRDSSDSALLRTATIFPYINFREPNDVWGLVDNYLKLTQSNDEVTLTCVMWIGLLYGASLDNANLTLDDALRFIPTEYKDQAQTIINPIKENSKTESFISPFGWTVSTFQMAAAVVFKHLPEFVSGEIGGADFLNTVFSESVASGVIVSRVASLAGSLAGMLVGIDSFSQFHLKEIHAFIPIEDGYDFLTRIEW